MTVSESETVNNTFEVVTVDELLFSNVSESEFRWTVTEPCTVSVSVLVFVRVGRPLEIRGVIVPSYVIVSVPLVRVAATVTLTLIERSNVGVAAVGDFFTESDELLLLFALSVLLVEIDRRARVLELLTEFMAESVGNVLGVLRVGLCEGERRDADVLWE